MNAAIDQQCEKYITENNLWDDVNPSLQIPNFNILQNLFIITHLHQNVCQKAMKVWELKLLGLSGDEVLPKDVYEQLKQTHCKM
jgi:methylmalonyl-CoA mutase